MDTFDQSIESFIAEHQNKSLADLALLLGKRPNLPKELILNQINGRRKAAKKLPFLLEVDQYKYPSSKALEQSSSEQTARYKAKLLGGKTIADLSGGMGVDSYFFSKEFQKVFYVEKNLEVFENTVYNFSKSLKVNNIEPHNTDALAFLQNLDRNLDAIFIDPDRRISSNRAFRIEDCEPQVGELLPLIFQKSKYCLIKLSPMLDISQAVKQLPCCKEVHVIAHRKECKELLFLLGKDHQDEVKIIARDLDQEDEAFSFLPSEERDSAVSYAEPLDYLYDPNVAILKAGGFKSVAQHFGLKKLAMNTHIYTSTNCLSAFPGRVLKIKEVVSPQKGVVKQANVVAKNFSMSVAEIKKKYKIQDGGDAFIYACSLENKKKVFIHAEKV